MRQRSTFYCCVTLIPSGLSCWCSIEDELKSDHFVFIKNSVANFALNWACNECITAKQGNKTYYRLEMNHHNGKSFSKLQYFLCYCFALKSDEKQLLYFVFTFITGDSYANFPLYLIWFWKAFWNLKLNWIADTALPFHLLPFFFHSPVWDLMNS